MTKRLILCVVAFASFSAVMTFAQETGRIAGRVARDDGTGVGGVTVVINEISMVHTTDQRGTFAFDNVPAGTHSLTFILGENSDTESGVAVTAGATATVEKAVDWTIGFVETITVTSASLQRERIVDAPAAVTVVDEDEIARKAAYGQVPKLLEFTPSANVTQSGIYDYNVNTRGFNSSLNRRVATLIDGRNPAVPFLGAQEWAAISFPTDDLASVELLRGPSAALYGANASSGVLNMTSKSPMQSQGGQVRFTVGEIDTTNLDFRWAGGLGNDWYVKAVAGMRLTGDFSVSRNLRIEDGRPVTVEYSVPCLAFGQTDCLPVEAVPLDPENDDEIYFGGIRFDKYLQSGSFFTLEGGYTYISGPVFQTGLGRVQLQEVNRPWARFNFTAPRWNFLFYYTGRDAPKQLNLVPGSNFALDTFNLQFEGQGNWTFAQDKVRLVVGGAYGHEDIDSADPDTGRQTLMFEPVDSDRVAVFAQADWNITEQLKVIFAGRFDDSTLYDAQFSPKAAVVYNFDPNHTLRFTYNRAFQVANYSEFFLQADVALPADLSGLEAFCTPFGVNCGFTNPTRVLFVGNESLEVEEIQTFEVGYAGIIQQKAFFTIDYYNSRANEFITDLLPQLGTALGRTNPNFGPWEPPEPLPPPIVAAIRGLAPPILSNNFDGANILVARSYSNFGEVDTQGIDIGLNYYFVDPWRFAFSYSWFDFNPQEDIPPGFEPLLAPNTPEHTFRAGLGYIADRWDADFAVRWVDDFRWAVGVFQGDIESYTTVDLNANFRVADHWKVGTNISNLFDNEHYQAFGGDLLRRRALVYVAFDWQ
jgi:iron complex outermembrane receptor protein